MGMEHKKKTVSQNTYLNSFQSECKKANPQCG